MSSSLKKDDDFAYESSVHGANLLLRLNSQREQGLLCDVTVVVEDQRFRAHRSVLAASSDYFLSRVVPPSNGELIVTLPEEVTVKGFFPLLQFAYTSKLLVNKDNLLEIRKCAKFLEVHDIEETCFEFLQLKFSDHKTESSECPRKKCCKSFCPKASVQRQADETQRAVVHEVEDIWREDFSQNLKCPSEIENLSPSPESPKQPCETFCFARENASNFSSLCPKYRKFQKACRSGRVRSVSTCSSNQEAQSPSPAPSSEISEGNSQQPKSQVEDPPVAQPDVGLNALPPPNTDAVYQNLTSSEDNIAPTAVFPPCFPLVPGLPDFSSVPFPCAYQPYRNVNYISPPNSSSPAGLPDRGSDEASNSRPTDLPRTDPEMSSTIKPQLIQERSNVEREVAEHLAKGFWTDVYRTEFSGQQEVDLVTPKQLQEVGTVDKRAECPWLAISISNEVPERTFTTLNPVSCPFISTINNEECATSPSRNSENMGSSPEKCPYVCPINLEEESETDSEEDSGESCSAKELECEKKLPFNAQKIISLSRYDFQSLVKMHNLTPEQLDCIHDIRRRSKNRIAAQRCRKRKLDCIQNLETEIRKLVNEKQHLLKERDQILSTLGETKQNLSGLCHQVCREASLSREQIQVLAKYSSSECPLSSLAPEGGKLLLQCEAILQELAGGLLNNVEASHPQGKEGGSMQSPGPVPVLTPEPALPPRHSSAQGGITDTCQQVTAKCTTDEQM